MCPEWQIANSDIDFVDNLEMPKFEFYLGLKRMAIIVEDIPTFEYFIDNVQKFSKIFLEITELKKFIRIGCRIISLYESNSYNDFDYYLRAIEDKFLQDPLKLDLSHTDLLIKVNHKNGFYQIGPIKKNEPWVQQNFKDFRDEKRLPKNGIGLDIDSFGTEFEIRREQDLIKTIDSTIKLSKSIEDAVIKSLEL